MICENCNKEVGDDIFRGECSACRAEDKATEMHVGDYTE